MLSGRGEFAPGLLRIYANHPTIVDFADAEDTKPHLEMRLLGGSEGISEYPLRTAAFSRVSALSLFFVRSFTAGSLSTLPQGCILIPDFCRATRKGETFHKSIFLASVDRLPIHAKM